MDPWFQENTKAILDEFKLKKASNSPHSQERGHHVKSLQSGNIRSSPQPHRHLLRITSQFLNQMSGHLILEQGSDAGTVPNGHNAQLRRPIQKRPQEEGLSHKHPEPVNPTDVPTPVQSPQDHLRHET